jgi:hypothetical protein
MLDNEGCDTHSEYITYCSYEEAKAHPGLYSRRCWWWWYSSCTATMISEHAPVLRYTYIASIVHLSLTHFIVAPSYLWCPEFIYFELSSVHFVPTNDRSRMYDSSAVAISPFVGNSLHIPVTSNSQQSCHQHYWCQVCAGAVLPLFSTE